MQFTMNDKVWSSAADGGGRGGQQGQFAPGPLCEGGPNSDELFQIRSHSSFT